MGQYILLKGLGLACAIRFSSNWISDRMRVIQENPDANADDLPELHAVAAGLKGYCCNAASLGLEEMRKTCGGASFLLSSGIASLESDYKWRATAEGDTTVMTMVTARYLMKATDKVLQGEEVTGMASCLVKLADPKYDPMRALPRASKPEDFMDVGFLLRLFEARTIVQVKLTHAKLQERMQKHKETFDTAWSALTLKASRTGESHVLFFLLDKNVVALEQCEDAACRLAMERLCALFALSNVLDGHQWLGLLDSQQVQFAEEAAAMLCTLLRPDAIGLVDAWDYPDRALNNSTIGRYDGEVYKAQYLAAKNAPLNTQAETNKILQKLKPYLDLDFLKLRNQLDPDLVDDPDDCSSYPTRGAKL